MKNNNHNEYDTARTEAQKAAAALAIARRKQTRELAWDWANTAARHLELIGITNARTMLGTAVWPDMSGLEAALATQRKDELVIVTRHTGLVEWLNARGYTGKVITRATPAEVLDKHVIGKLPLHLAAITASVTSVAIPDCPSDRRGEELSAQELDQYGAYLRTYTVKQITAIEPG